MPAKPNDSIDSDSTETDISKINVNRRKVLQTSGLGVATIVGLSAPSAAKRFEKNHSKADYLNIDIKKFQERVANRYGKNEAKIATRIAENKIKEAKETNLSNDVVYEQIKKAVLNNVHTPKGSTAIQETDKDLQEHQNSVVTDGNSVPSEQTSRESSSVHAESTHNISIIGARKRKKTNYNCRAYVRTDVSRQILGAVTNASVFGGGYAAGRMYGHYHPPSHRTYYITCKYYRQGFVRNATAKVYFYVRRRGEGIRRKVAESMNSKEGTTTRTVPFTLRTGKLYTIGIELYTQANAGGDIGAYSDYYYNTSFNGRRHLKAKRFTIN